MQPYQRASQQINRQQEAPGDFIKSAGITAAGFIGGGTILNRILPFLSRHIPTDIAVKGLTKIDKRFGKFFDNAAKIGSTVDRALKFIKDKFAPDEETPPPQTGSEALRQESLQKFNQQKKPRMVDELSQQFEQNYGQQQQAQQQRQKPNAQNTDQVLLAALEKILSM
jgi:hypothetical protein